MIKKWFILVVKSRQELKVAERLSELKMEVYCPLVTEVKHWSDRKKKINSPLFKSYIFVRLEDAERRNVFDIPGVTRYLFWLGKPAVVRDEEMNTLRNWLSDEKVDQLTLSKFNPGDQVTIKRGVFKDQEVVVQEVGTSRVKLVMQGLGVVVNIKLKEIV